MNEITACSSTENRVCRYPNNCPTVLYSDNVALSGTNGYNVWSTSCNMISQMGISTGKTVKIKKSSSMSGELVIDRGGDSATNPGKIFWLSSSATLIMEDVTIANGRGSQGGAFSVKADNAKAVFTNCILRDNISAGYGKYL